jgi:uncharacterized membrane-anchored protein
VAIQLAKWITGIFLPLLLSFGISEIFGWSRSIQSDALTQAVWESFRHRRLGGIIASIAAVAIMVLGGAAVSEWMERGLRAETIIRPDPQNVTTSSFLCTPHSLLNKTFAGSAMGNDVTITVTKVNATRAGGELAYSILIGGDLRRDGNASFDQATCSVTFPELLSRGRIQATGSELTIVAIEPLWTLRRYNTR